MQNNIYIYIAIMVIVTTLIRVLPLTLIRKEIKNVTLRSFLYYIPYVTLAVMTFPAILSATGSPISAWAALAWPYCQLGWEKACSLYPRQHVSWYSYWNCFSMYRYSPEYPFQSKHFSKNRLTVFPLYDSISNCSE